MFLREPRCPNKRGYTVLIECSTVALRTSKQLFKLLCALFAEAIK